MGEPDLEVILPYSIEAITPRYFYALLRNTASLWINIIASKSCRFRKKETVIASDIYRLTNLRAVVHFDSYRFVNIKTVMSSDCYFSVTITYNAVTL